jgi:hypothetical protein
MAINYGSTVRTIWGSSGGDLDRYWRRVSGGEAVMHAILRRLITERGTLSWAPSVGFDVRGLLNEAISSSSNAPLLAIQNYVRAECIADERVEDATVTASVNRSTAALTLSVDLQLSDNATFSFVVAVSALTLSVLSVR